MGKPAEGNWTEVRTSVRISLYVGSIDYEMRENVKINHSFDIGTKLRSKAEH